MPIFRRCIRFAENGWRVRRVNNGATADNPDAYANRGAEIWFEGRTQIERQKIILPNDRELVAQLTTRLGWPNSKGRLELEGKQAMRARGLSSPDRADAVLGAMTRAQTGGATFRRVGAEGEGDEDGEWRASMSPRGRILV
ncbi:MAG: hypothetical protein ABSE16_10270 [Verrucomicrobiota bacterium]|jgi:hypothetical protein